MRNIPVNNEVYDSIKVSMASFAKANDLSASDYLASEFGFTAKTAPTMIYNLINPNNKEKTLKLDEFLFIIKLLGSHSEPTLKAVCASVDFIPTPIKFLNSFQFTTMLALNQSGLNISSDAGRYCRQVLDAIDDGFIDATEKANMLLMLENLQHTVLKTIQAVKGL